MNANATIHTVDNNANAPAGVYTNIQLAAENATAGDTFILLVLTLIMVLFLLKKNCTFLELVINPTKLDN